MECLWAQTHEPVSAKLIITLWLDMKDTFTVALHHGNVTCQTDRGRHTALRFKFPSPVDPDSILLQGCLPVEKWCMPGNEQR